MNNKDKKLISLKMIIATLLGAALFLIFFMYGAIPSPIKTTHFQIAYGLSALFGAIYGPLASTIMVFLGHLTNDFLIGGEIFWNWIIASSITGLFSGLAYYKVNLLKGEFPNSYFFMYNFLGHSLAWLIVTPILDTILINENINVIIRECSFAFINNTITSLVVGGLLASIVAFIARFKIFNENEE